MLELQVKESYKPTENSCCSPESVLAMWQTKYKDVDREYFVCFHLDSRNRVKSFETVSIGTLNSSLVHPREVFKAAILSNAASIILCHNHPSGDTGVSTDDLVLTKRLVDAGEILGIEVLDHVIIGADNYLSMEEKGMM